MYIILDKNRNAALDYKGNGAEPELVIFDSAREAADQLRGWPSSIGLRVYQLVEVTE